jgi:hypothetical protein
MKRARIRVIFTFDLLFVTGGFRFASPNRESRSGSASAFRLVVGRRGLSSRRHTPTRRDRRLRCLDPACDRATAFVLETRADAIVSRTDENDLASDELAAQLKHPMFERTVRSILVLLATWILACGAHSPARAPIAAQAEEEEEEEEEEAMTSTIASDDDVASYKDRTVIDFDDDVTQTGSVARPGTISAKRRPNFKPMVRRPSVETSTTSDRRER